MKETKRQERDRLLILSACAVRAHSLYVYYRETEWDSTIRLSGTNTPTTSSWDPGFDHSHAEWLLSPAGSVFWQSSQSSACHPCSRQCFPGQHLKKTRRKPCCYIPNTIVFLIVIAGCHVVIRGAITRLRAHNQSPGDIVMSAINCGRLGTRSNVKHFNWMSWQMQNGDPRTNYLSCLLLFLQNIPWHPLFPGTSWRYYISKKTHHFFLCCVHSMSDTATSQHPLFLANFR